jgi:uncharacterized membrane protein
VIVVMIPIMVAVSAMAPCPHVFQVTTAALRLAAVFTVLAFGVMQFSLRITDLLLAFSIVITVYRPRGDRSAQK